MIAEVAKTLAGDDARHLVIEAPTGVGKTLSYLIPGIAISRDPVSYTHLAESGVGKTAR